MKKYTLALLEKYRRRIALALLLPTLCVNYIVFTNFTAVRNWLMAATGANLLPEGNGDAWVGLFLLLGLSVCVGVLLKVAHDE